MVKIGIFNPHLTYFSHIFFWTFFCLNHKTKWVRPFWVEKSTRSASWGILWVPKHRKKTGFKFTNKNFQKWQKWPWHIQENIKWVGVVFQRKIFFLTKKVNKQLKSLSLGKKVHKRAILEKKLFSIKVAFFHILERQKIFRDVLATFIVTIFFKIQNWFQVY